MQIGNQNYIASSTALLACIVVMNLLEIEDQQIKLRRIQTETFSSAHHWLIFHVYLSTRSQTY